MYGLEIPSDQRDLFYLTVWKIVRQIPRGKVSTYGQIARFIPPIPGLTPEDFHANKARWVGYAMAASPKDVPWQRVVNSQGKISARSGAETQIKLLEAEEVAFDAHGRIDMKQFGWQGPAEDWLLANGLVAPDSPQQLSFL